MNSGGAVGIRTPHLRLRLVSVEHFPQLRRSLRNRRIHLALQRRQPFNIGFDVFHLLVSRQRVREDETPAFCGGKTKKSMITQVSMGTHPWG